MVRRTFLCLRLSLSDEVSDEAACFLFLGDSSLSEVLELLLLPLCFFALDLCFLSFDLSCGKRRQHL